MTGADAYLLFMVAIATACWIYFVKIGPWLERRNAGRDQLELPLPKGQKTKGGPPPGWSSTGEDSPRYQN